MSNMYEDVRRILENRRIHSEIRHHDRIVRLYTQYPQLQKIEQEISRVMEDEMLLSLDGHTGSGLADKLSALDQKRAELLREYGLTDKDFEVQPFCAKCADTGSYEIKDENGSRTVMCHCVRKLLAPAMLGRSGVTKYPGYSFSEGKEEYYGSNEAAKNVYRTVKTLAGEHLVPDMVLFGTAGKGKTFTAVAAAREYAEAGISSLVVKQTEAQEIMMEHRKVVQSFYTESSKERSIEDRRAALTEVELLVLDDLGVEPKTPNTEADLLYILDSRMLSGRKTIITTNYDIPSLKERYGARVYDRLQRNFQCFSFCPKKEG